MKKIKEWFPNISKFPKWETQEKMVGGIILLLSVVGLILALTI